MAMDCSSRCAGWPLSSTRASPCPPAIYNYMIKSATASHHFSSSHSISLVLPLHISHPWASHQMRCILCRPTITYAPLHLAFSNFPEPLPLWPLVRDHIHQPLHCHWRPHYVRWCLRVYWEFLFDIRWRSNHCLLRSPPSLHRPPCSLIRFFIPFNSAVPLDPHQSSGALLHSCH